MAQFIGYIRGQRNQVHRIGTKNSGLSVVANGWDIGGEIELTHENGEDVIRFFVTGGSHADIRPRLVGEFHLIDGKVVER